MKLIIAGGREYQLTDVDYTCLDTVHRHFKITEEICGLAKGADTGGEEWAKSRGIKVVYFIAQWSDITHPNARVKVRPDGSKYDAGAGHRRNELMAEYAAPDGGVVLFPGGRGTADMWLKAMAHDLWIFDWRRPDARRVLWWPELDMGTKCPKCGSSCQCDPAWNS